MPDRRDDPIPVPDGIPITVWAEAVRWAVQMCQPCTRCGQPCRCGGWLEKLNGIVYRRLSNWQRRYHNKLFRKGTWKEQERPGVSLGPAWVMEDEARHPQNRRPEPKGFEKDHVEGEQWRRFKRLK